MTDKYFYWIASQAARDETLLELGLIALALVSAWELLRFLPPGWAAALRRCYLIGGVALYAAGLLIPYLSGGST